MTRPIGQHDWSAAEAALLQMVDDLHVDDCVSDATWGQLTEHFSAPDILEFMAAALQYRLVSGLLNSCGVQRDEGVPGWPEPPSAAG